MLVGFSSSVFILQLYLNLSPSRLIHTVLTLQQLSYVFHLNIPANMQVYMTELNEASGLKRIAFLWFGIEKASMVTVRLLAISFRALSVLKLVARRLNLELRVDEAIKTWVCLLFMGLADSALVTTKPSLLLFLCLVWISASVHFFMHPSKQEYLSPLFLQHRLLIVLASQLLSSDWVQLLSELIVNLAYTAAYQQKGPRG